MYVNVQFFPPYKLFKKFLFFFYIFCLLFFCFCLFVFFWKQIGCVLMGYIVYIPNGLKITALCQAPIAVSKLCKYDFRIVPWKSLVTCYCFNVASVHTPLLPRRWRGIVSIVLSSQAVVAISLVKHNILLLIRAQQKYANVCPLCSSRSGAFTTRAGVGKLLLTTFSAWFALDVNHYLPVYYIQTPCPQWRS